MTRIVCFTTHHDIDRFYYLNTFIYNNCISFTTRRITHRVYKMLYWFVGGGFLLQLGVVLLVPILLYIIFATILKFYLRALIFMICISWTCVSVSSSKDHSAQKSGSFRPRRVPCSPVDIVTTAGTLFRVSWIFPSTYHQRSAQYLIWFVLYSGLLCRDEFCNHYWPWYYGQFCHYRYVFFIKFTPTPHITKS